MRWMRGLPLGTPLRSESIISTSVKRMSLGSDAARSPGWGLYPSGEKPPLNWNPPIIGTLAWNPTLNWNPTFNWKPPFNLNPPLNWNPPLN